MNSSTELAPDNGSFSLCIYSTIGGCSMVPCVSCLMVVCPGSELAHSVDNSASIDVVGYGDLVESAVCIDDVAPTIRSRHTWEADL